MPGFDAKVLTVSDGVFEGTREDVSGGALAAAVTRAGGTVTERGVCSDGADTVEATLRRMSAGFTGVIVTTGGTGFAPRDETPEGTARVITRAAPGLAEAMRAVNPLGRLSRGVVGIVDRCIVLNTPGSPKGCVEQFEAVADVLTHAVALLAQTPTEH
ncbi:MAG: molybdenum cofactor biosynthesis protein B [Acidimicrobiales bacterium]